VCSLYELLAGWREQKFDQLQCCVRMVGILQHGRTKADRLPIEGLSCVGGEMDPLVGGCHRWIAQVDSIWERQVRQGTLTSGTQIEKQSVDLTPFQLSQIQLVDLLRVGIAPQDMLFEIREMIVFLCKSADQESIVS
jgi:hypothetical protein